MAIRGATGWDHRTHFHVGPKGNPCTHLVRTTNRDDRRMEVCGRELSHHMHRYYRCPSDPRCLWRGYTVEAQVEHVKENHSE